MVVLGAEHLPRTSMALITFMTLMKSMAKKHDTSGGGNHYKDIRSVVSISKEEVRT
jgi:hypothetical protein